MSKPTVIVIGAGWAGLTAAVALCAKGYPVTVLESARQTGGRARRVVLDELTVDNGQHILVGAYRETLRILQQMGIDLTQTLLRLPLALIVADVSGNTVSIKAPPLPAPLHLLGGLLFAKGLSWADRRAAIRFGNYLQLLGYQLAEDISLEQLFERTQQTPTLIKQLWEPLCLAVMNTPIAEASANLFMRVFQDAFTRKRHDADLLLPRVDLSALFADAAEQFLRDHGGQLLTSHRVTRLSFEGQRVTSLHTETATYHADQIILATPASQAISLLETHPACATTVQQLQQLHYEPIVTVYLQYPAEIQLPQAMFGCSGTLTQWVLDRGQLCGQAGLMAVVISSRGPHLELDNAELAARLHAELHQQFPHWPAPLSHHVIREKRATFSCQVAVDNLRPPPTTPLTNLWLAGDYTATGYPATLEGAVRSGLSCASAIQQQP